MELQREALCRQAGTGARVCQLRTPRVAAVTRSPETSVEHSPSNPPEEPTPSVTLISDFILPNREAVDLCCFESLSLS